jgi:hypothetical protein
MDIMCRHFIGPHIRLIYLRIIEMPVTLDDSELRLYFKDVHSMPAAIQLQNTVEFIVHDFTCIVQKVLFLSLFLENQLHRDVQRIWLLSEGTFAPSFLPIGKLLR